MKKDIFREEAVEHYYSDEARGLVGIAPLTSRYLLIAYSAFALLFISFFCFIPLNKTLASRGLIVPSGGYSPIISYVDGYFTSSSVSEGEQVVEGQQMFSLNSVAGFPSGVVNMGQLSSERSRLQAALDDLYDSYGAVLSELDLRISNSSKKLEYGGKEGVGAQDDAGLLSLLTQKAQISQQLSSDEEVLKKRLEEVENNIAFIKKPGSAVDVYAPLAGQFMGNARRAGDYIARGDLLGRVIPDKSRKTAVLYINRDDIPLLAEGQKLSIFFDAFSTKKNRFYQGVVKNIPLTSFSENDRLMKQPIAFSNDSYYHVDVELVFDHMRMSSFDVERIKYDMTFDAKVHVRSSTLFSRNILPFFTRMKESFLGS